MTFIAPPVIVMVLVFVDLPIVRLALLVKVWFVKVVFSENKLATGSITTFPVDL